jgi:1,6-anhydro-N-acetylmuramate kinase
MDEIKLKKIGAELEKARAKRNEWDTKVKVLEKKYKEAENTCIHEIVHAADLTPEQLAAIIRHARAGDLSLKPAEIVTMKPEEKEVP